MEENKVIETIRNGKAGRETGTKTPIKRKTKINLSSSYDFDISGDFLIRQIGKMFMDDVSKWDDGLRKIKQEFSNKISTYKSADSKRDFPLYTKDDELVWDDIATLIIAGKGKCFYCHSNYIVCYQNVLEPLQWSVDRIDNLKAHIKGNIVISCLRCNLKRRQRGHKEFYDTSNLILSKEN
jgi:hypothetical protein